MLKVKIKKAANKKVIYTITNLVTSTEWSGSDTQASRTATIGIISNKADKELPNVSIETGDILYLYEGSQLIFCGRITQQESHATPGSQTYTAQDFANVLLRSTVSYRFKNTTPEKIAKRVLTDMGVKIGKLAKTKVSIDKWIVDGEKAYNVILSAYRKAREKTDKIYRLCMEGTLFNVKAKDESTGVTLTLHDSVTETTLTENAGEIVNRVEIVDDKGKRIGEVKDKNSIKLFGVAQEVYQKEKGVSAKAAAKQMLKGPSKEASVEAVGDVRCIAGKSILLKDEYTGTTGKFWIEEDSHSFAAGLHTMSLKLRFERVMEGDEDEKTKPIAVGSATCYYSDNSDKFHSAKKCGTGLTNPICSTVDEATKTGRGKCSRCWQ